MTVTSFANGTQTAVINTEHTLAQVNVAGVFQFYVDLSNMAAGDVVELRVKQIILHSGSLRVVEFMAYAGAQPSDDVIKFSSPIASELTDTGSITVTLKQTFGTGRDFYWKVLSLEDETSLNAIKTVTDALAANVWNALTSGFSTAGSIGKLLKDNIDAAISSRSTYAGGDTSGTTTLLSRIGGSITITGGKVDVNDKTGFALTSGEHTNIASDTQTGLTAQGYTTTRAGYLDTLNGLVAAIWNAMTSGFSTSGSIGRLLKDDVDATISSRSTYAGGDTPGVTTLLSRIGSALSITGGKVDVNDKTGFSLSSGGIQAIWDALTSALTTVGSIGKLLVTNINATISSRSTLAQSDILSDATPFPGADIDAAISTRLATSGYTAPLTAAGTRSAVGLASANLDTQLSGIKTDVDAIPTNPLLTTDSRLNHLDADVSSRSTLSAANVWDYLTSAIATVGSIGKLLKDNIDAAISSRSSQSSINSIPTNPLLTTDSRLNHLDADVSSRSTLAQSDILSDATPFPGADIDAPISSGGGGGGGGGATAAQIWNYLTSALSTGGSIGKLIKDMLDVPLSSITVGAAVQAQQTNYGLAGSDISILRGDSMAVTITGLGSLASRTKLYFTAKASVNDPDSDAYIQIRESGGLLYFNRGVASDSSLGSITVDDETAGNITIRLDASQVALLDSLALYYDVEVVRSSGVTTVITGKLTVAADITGSQ